MDWDCRKRAWEKEGRVRRPPRPRVLPTVADLHTVSWWVTLLQVMGIMVSVGPFVWCRLPLFRPVLCSANGSHQQGGCCAERWMSQLSKDGNILLWRWVMADSTRPEQECCTPTQPLPNPDVLSAAAACVGAGLHCGLHDRTGGHGEGTAACGVEVGAALWLPAGRRDLHRRDAEPGTLNPEIPGLRRCSVSAGTSLPRSAGSKHHCPAHAHPCLPCPAVASLLACVEETGSWWRGLVPTSWSDVHSISWIAGKLSGALVSGPTDMARRTPAHASRTAEDIYAGCVRGTRRSPLWIFSVGSWPPCHPPSAVFFAFWGSVGFAVFGITFFSAEFR